MWEMINGTRLLIVDVSPACGSRNTWRRFGKNMHSFSSRTVAVTVEVLGK